MVSIMMTAGLVFAGCGIQPEEPPLPSTPTLPDTFSSALELSTQKITLEEASSIIGVTIPTPSYLPKGYKIWEVYIEVDSTVILLISDEEIKKEMVTHTDATGTHQYYEVECKMRMDIRWLSQGGRGTKLSGEWVTISERTISESGVVMVNRGLIVDRDEHNDFWWEWYPNLGERGEFEIVLSANKSIPERELVKVAKSLPDPKQPNPPRSIETEILPEDNIVVPQGETGMVAIRVISESTEPLEISVSSAEELPEGVEVEFHPDAFSLNPGQTVEVEVTLTVSPTAPPPIWSRWILPRQGGEAWAHAPPITEAAYYRVDVYFNCTFYDDIDRQEELAKTIKETLKLRFEELPPVPLGMLTLDEAQEIVEFPIRDQLPLYMPEGTEPPFIGLTVTPEEPHGVTVHYSTFQLLLVPEPGVTGPSPDAVGERITIRSDQGLLGDNRIDWWALDIHYAIVSDQVSVEEQVRIARSMLLVVPGGGSWLPNKVWENLRWLRDSEKDRLTEIALNTPKALEYLKEYNQYTIKPGWIAIFEGGYTIVDYEAVETGVPLWVPNVPQTAVIYPMVHIHFEGPIIRVVMVAVDLNTEMAVLTESASYTPSERGPHRLRTQIRISVKAFIQAPWDMGSEVSESAYKRNPLNIVPLLNNLTKSSIAMGG